jgi:hypothetical protein
METNREQISSRSVSPVLTRLRYEADEFDEQVDWMMVAQQTLNATEA